MKKFSIEYLTQISAQNPWKAVGVWLLVVVFSVYMIVGYLGSALTNKYTFTKDLESKEAQKVLEEKMGVKAETAETIVIESKDKTVNDPEYRVYVESIYQKVIALESNVKKGVNYYISPNPAFVSEDKHMTVILLTMAGGEEKAVDNAEKVRQVLDENQKEGFETGITGIGSINADTNKVSEETIQKAEMFGIPLALIVMISIFGTLVAALVPLLLAGVSIVSAMGITSIVGQWNVFVFFAVNMIVMMGLAVGIDYALFIVSRFREERYKGYDTVEAIARTGATASHAVFFSGLIVLIALGGLMIVPMNVFRSLAAGAIFVVAIALVSVLTLLPAIFSILGDKVNSLKIPFIKQKNLGADRRGGFWDKVSALVMRHPILSVTVTAGILINLTIPAFNIKTGASGADSIPDNLQSVQTLHKLEDNFHLSVSPPLQIVVDGDVESKDVEQGMDELRLALSEKPDVFGEAEFKADKEKDVGLLTVPMLLAANTQEATNEVKNLRENTISKAFEGVDAEVLVGGRAAENLDYFELTDEYRPIVFGFVLGLSFILLMLVFRSLVVPAKAIAMNLLSVGATYGLLVLVFQEGYGSKIFGFDTVEAIDAWIPLFLFAVLFGLSMDYHVFLLSRIRERFLRTGDNTESVAFGLRTTGRIITGAALIMVIIFAGFAAGDLVMFQQMGFGLGVAVLLDATIIRSILVPASMKLLGKWNWYLPRWLEWLPEINVEEKEE